MIVEYDKGIAYYLWSSASDILVSRSHTLSSIAQHRCCAIEERVWLRETTDISAKVRFTDGVLSADEVINVAGSFL